MHYLIIAFIVLYLVIVFLYTLVPFVIALLIGFFWYKSIKYIFIHHYEKNINNLNSQLSESKLEEEKFINKYLNNLDKKESLVIKKLDSIRNTLTYEYEKHRINGISKNYFKGYEPESLVISTDSIKKIEDIKHEILDTKLGSKQPVLSNDNVQFSLLFLVFVVPLIGIFYFVSPKQSTDNINKSITRQEYKPQSQSYNTKPREVIKSYNTSKSTKIVKSNNNKKSLEKKVDNSIKVPYYTFEDYSLGKLTSTDELFVKFGSPTIVKDYENNLGNSLLLHNTSSDMYDQIILKLKKGKRTYTLNYDMFIPDNKGNLTLFFYTPKVRNIYFYKTGKLYTYLMDGKNRKDRYEGVYPQNRWFNVNINIDLNKRLLIFKIDGKNIFSTKFVSSGNDIDIIGFSVPKNIKAAIDNLRISKEIKDFYVEPIKIKEPVHTEEKSVVENIETNTNSKNEFFSWIDGDVYLGEIKLLARKYKDGILELDVDLENFSNHSKGGLSVSFPNLKRNKTINIIENNGFKKANVFKRGSEIYNKKYKKNIKSKYILVEGEGSNWKKHTSKSIKLHIGNFQKGENLVLNLRGTFKENKKIFPFPNVESNDFVKGQQGFLNYEVIISLDNLKIIDSSTDGEYNTKKDYQNFQINTMKESITEVVENVEESNDQYQPIVEEKPVVEQVIEPIRSSNFNSSLGKPINRGSTVYQKPKEDCRNTPLGCREH